MSYPLVPDDASAIHFWVARKWSNTYTSSVTSPEIITSDLRELVEFAANSLTVLQIVVAGLSFGLARLLIGLQKKLDRGIVIGMMVPHIP